MPNDNIDKPESMDEFGDEVRRVLMEFREKRMLAKIARDIKIQPGRLTEMITRDDNGEWKRKITPYYITKLVDGGYMTVEQILRGRKLEELPEGHKTFFQRTMISKKTLELFVQAKERGIDIDGLIRASLGLPADSEG